MSWIVFSNFQSGQRGFSYFDDEDEARESMDQDLQHYEKYGVAIEMGIGEIVQTAKVNWED